MLVRSMAIFTFALASVLVGCSGDDTAAVVPGTGTSQDTGASDAGNRNDTPTGADTSTGSDTSSGSDTSMGEDASAVPLSDMISALTQPCYDICLLATGCGEPDFADLGECEDTCDSDTGYILGNAQDDAATRACLSAYLATEQCVLALNCDDFATWYATDSGTYPCSDEDRAEETACTGVRWYDEF